MTTTILTGRSLTLTIATVNYSTQILSSAINFDTERLTFDTLAGKAYKYIDSNVTLDIEFLNDAGKTTPVASLETTMDIPVVQFTNGVLYKSFVPQLWQSQNLAFPKRWIILLWIGRSDSNPFINV